MKNRVGYNRRTVLSLGGAFMAFSMGSGFASGQEVMQFFSSFGLLGSLGAGAVAFIVFTWVATTVIVDGKRLGSDTSVGIYTYYCGNHVGTFFEYIIPLLMFIFLNVMFSGAGATFHEYLGLPPVIGISVIAGATVITVLLGLSRLVKVISFIGIVIIILSIIICIISLMSNWQVLIENIQTSNRLKMPVATFDSWWISGLLYASFNVITSLPFMSGLGRQAGNEKEAFMAGIYGSSSYVGAAILMNLALLGNISLVFGKQIPFLTLATSILPILGDIFIIILIAGIYTTAVPMLWSICDIICYDKKSWTYPLTAILITGLSFLGGRLPFGVLIGSVYPVIGMIGFMLIIFMIYKKYIKI